jgi:hypothetical protein
METKRGIKWELLGLFRAGEKRRAGTSFRRSKSRFGGAGGGEERGRIEWGRWFETRPGQIANGPFGDVAEVREFAATAGAFDLAVAALRRIHSRSFLGCWSISCRLTRYPGQLRILVNSLSVNNFRV